MVKCPYCNGVGEVTAQEDFGIGDLMRLHRQNSHFTLREVEAATGISNAYISQLETGKVKSPGIDMVIKLCDIYGINVSDIVDFMKGKKP